VDTSNWRQERRKEKTGIIAPLAMHVNNPRKRSGLYGIVGKISWMISQNASVWNWPLRFHDLEKVPCSWN
jgi:hypothetical protein